MNSPQVARRVFTAGEWDLVRNVVCEMSNLVLIANPAANHLPDFQKIVGHLKTDAPDVHASIWHDFPYKWKRWTLASRRTMVFSPVPLTTFVPVRGRTFQGSSLAKSEEYAALVKANVAVPQYRLLTENDPKPDVSTLGKYVVVKPDRGARGAHVKIMRAARVKWEKAESRIAGDSDALLAQEFIYTGRWPVSFRITTMFGQVLFALKVEANHDRAALDGPDGFMKTPGLSVVSNSKGCVMSLTEDEEIIRFAEAAHAAFPEIPLLGIDVVRRATDGKLFIVEVNASGWVWHFSSPLGLRAQKEFGFNLDTQFGGLRKAAKVLADAARRYAA